MSEGRRFSNEDQVIAEVARLRKGYSKKGTWTLAQICWHVGLPIKNHLKPPEPMDLAPTPEQAKLKAGFVDFIIQNHTAPPQAKNAPPSFIPPETAGEAEIDEYLGLLSKLKAYPHPKVMMGPIGPVTIAEFRSLSIFHAAHHLAFLVPAGRRSVRYANFDEVKADVQKLRSAPYSKAGNWSLEQACHHLTKAFELQMSIAPYPATDEQKAARPIVEKVLATGEVPQGLQAPEMLSPPPTASAAAVDEFLATLEKVKAHNQPITMHRRFGPLTPDEFRKLGLAHCAHHLSHLIPAKTTA